MNPRSPSEGRPHRGLRARQKELAQQTILDAAEHVFAQKGIDAPMEAIAAEAGVAVGTLYNHFESREALLEALFTGRREQMLAAVVEASEAAKHLPFRERLVATIAGLIAAVEQQTEFRKLVFQADLPRRRSKREALAREILGSLDDLFVHGHRERALGEDDGFQRVALISLLQAALSLNAYAPEKLPLSAIPERVARQFLDGAGARRR